MEKKQSIWLSSEKPINKDIRIDLPYGVKKIIDELERRGFEAYVVGGAVRDSLMGKIPKDFDIATSATPDKVKKIFKNTIDTGLIHGTVTVRLNKNSYEVTTYRIDGEYEDNRHPKNVEFTENIKKDLERRDFTINAMAYNERTGILDLCDGLRDFNLGIIRCVGEPEKRFDEDSLRVIRAIRFAAKTGFRLDTATALAIIKKAPLLKNISAERIRGEINEILLSDMPEAILLATELGITKIVLPEVDMMLKTCQTNRNHFTDVYSHSLIALKYVPKDPVLRWAVLLHDVGKPFTKTTDTEGVDHFKLHAEKGEETAKKILLRLKFDNNTVRRVCKLILYHAHRLQDDKIGVRRLYSIMQDDMESMFILQKADLLAHSSYKLEDRLDGLNAAYRHYLDIVRNKDAIKTADLKINGNDLKSLGIVGTDIGTALKYLLNRVLDDPSLNERDTLLKMASQIQTENLRKD